MKGFEVLGYPLWNDVKHNSSREDGYIRWSFCSFKDGVIDCNGSEASINLHFLFIHLFI